MTDKELIARLRSGIAPHEYKHVWGCTVLQMAAKRIEELTAQLTQELVKNLPAPPDARWRFDEVPLPLPYPDDRGAEAWELYVTDGKRSFCVGDDTEDDYINIWCPDDGWYEPIDLENYPADAPMLLQEGVLLALPRKAPPKPFLIVEGKIQVVPRSIVVCDQRITNKEEFLPPLLSGQLQLDGKGVEVHYFLKEEAHPDSSEAGEAETGEAK